MSEKNEIVEKLVNYFKEREEVLSAYLFGSAASDKLRSDSDVDIAVILDKAIPSNSYFDYRLSAMSDVSRLLHREVDIIVFNEARHVLAHQILKYGIRIFERNKERSRSLEARALMEYFDFLPYRKKCEEAMIRHIKKAS